MQKTAHMIQRSAPSWQTGSWKKVLANSKRPTSTLTVAADPQAQAEFPLRATAHYQQLITADTADDPLLQQILPQAIELTPSPGFSSDPLNEANASPTPGLLHKYAGRVLWVLGGACAIHCRYCFRRHFPYEQHRPSQQHIAEGLAYITADPSIREVILSGGDPLSLPDSLLADLCQQLAQIPHLIRLRIHSRIPTVLPQRIDAGLLHWLQPLALQKVIVTHCNHPNELSPASAEAMHWLKQANVSLLNQSVLLHGINDQATILSELSEALFAQGILPYYLHLLDKVQGSAHFDVPTDKALALMTELRSQLPGFLVPKLVREQDGLPHKQPIV